jgi:formate dehydrogenase iron-sulfur subunit
VRSWSRDRFGADTQTTPTVCSVSGMVLPLDALMHDGSAIDAPIIGPVDVPVILGRKAEALAVPSASSGCGSGGCSTGGCGTGEGSTITKARTSIVKQGFTHRGPELLPLDAGQQYRFGFSMDACIGCHSCEVACAEQNGLPDGTTWRRVGEIEGGDHPTSKRFHLSMSCNHCLEPACLIGCPTNAYEKLTNGVVVHHADDCIGCQYCTWNCPYSVPAFQPDRRIVTKCDMCQPRLSEGLAPACVGACPTHAITVEAFVPEEWRLDHAEGNAPALPSADLTLSTTRIELPRNLPIDMFSASDWNLRPEHPHWPLVWLTLLSQIAVGASCSIAFGAAGLPARMLAAGLAGISLLGAMFHLGRPIAAWKAVRNLRRSWLSREVVLLSAYAGFAMLAVPFTVALPLAAVSGLAGIYASARLYIVPGRPAWNSPLTVVRFVATGAAIGPALTGRPIVAAAGAGVALAATALNWLRLRHNPNQSWLGAVRLELRWFGPWTAARWLLTVLGVVLLLTSRSFVAATVAIGPEGTNGLAARATDGVTAMLNGGSSGTIDWVVAGRMLAGILAVGVAELIGRWLFFVTVVPLNMPGAFWRGAAGSHR